MSNNMIAEGGRASSAAPGPALAEDLKAHFAKYIAVTDLSDLDLLVLWTISTHVADELYTTARLLIDSTMPGSGKTTLLEHLAHLCVSPVQAASISSPALLVRLLQDGVRTLLIDEVDRSLNPKKPGVEDLIAIINSGYKRGATRPVLTPTKGGGWEVREMPTFCPVAMAGNSPHLPDDTKSRCIRILLMPDLDGVIEDSDWEKIEDNVHRLHQRIVAFADQNRATVAQDVELPAGCLGRAKEKWRPLKRVAVAIGGRWPAIADQLILRSIAEDDHERDAGLRAVPPGMVLITDLFDVWPDDDDLVPTKDLVAALVRHNPEYWGENSNYGKALTDTRFGRLVTQATKVTSQRPGGRGQRGYTKAQFIQVWHRLGIGRDEPGAPGYLGAPGADPDDDVHQVNRVIQVHQVEAEHHEPGVEAGADRPPTPLDARRQNLGNRRTVRLKGRELPRCLVCGKTVTAGQGDTHLSCARKQRTPA